MALLEVKNIHKSFDKLEVLKGISFELEKGKVLAIIGSSGSGKTTLLRCLNFLEQINGGEIIVDDDVLISSKNATKYSYEAIRDKRLNFGLVFQSFNLFPHQNVTVNVALPSILRAKEKLVANAIAPNKDLPFFKRIVANIKVKRTLSTQYKQIKAEETERAKSILDMVGLSQKLASYPHELSGGQQQRVAIARAMALNPKVLCFDEPTSALDPELTGEVLKTIKNLKSSDRTMIIVTHEMEFARDVADKIIFMADGIIEEMGTPAEVFGNPQSPKTQSFLKTYLEGK